jgi:hypothetical protein
METLPLLSNPANCLAFHQKALDNYQQAKQQLAIAGRLMELSIETQLRRDFSHLCE